MVNQGDIFFVDFNPSRGHEQKNRRPAIALSNDLVAKTSNMTIVAPISSTKRSFPMYHRLKTTNNVRGQVLLDQTKSLDLNARRISKKDVIEKIDKSELQDIINLYKLLFDID